MFVCSVRASSIRFFAILALTLSVLVAVVFFGERNTVLAAAGGEEYRFGGVRTEEERVDFLRQFGIEVKGAPVEEKAFTMPSDFDRVLLGYNEIQKAQGLDVSKYQNKKITRYTYEVANADYDGTVYVNLLVYRSRVVGADVSSADPEGFIMPLVDFVPKT